MSSCSGCPYYVPIPDASGKLVFTCVYDPVFEEDVFCVVPTCEVDVWK